MNGKSILLIEDNPDDEALTLRAFRQNNIANEVVVARDGTEALAMLHGGLPGRETCCPTLVLLDLQLPKIGGLEVLRRLRADPRTRSLPVVVLTTSNEDRDVAEAYRNGANSYILKPVSFSDFTAAIRQLGLYWLVLNEPPRPAPPSP